MLLNLSPALPDFLLPLRLWRCSLSCLKYKSPTPLDIVLPKGAHRSCIVGCSPESSRTHLSSALLTAQQQETPAMIHKPSVYAKIKGMIRSSNEDITCKTSMSFVNNYGKRGPASEKESVCVKRLNTGLLSGAVGRYCVECDTHFSRPYTFNRHLNVAHGGPPKHVCNIDSCDRSFARADILERHQSTKHGNGKIACPTCGSLVRKDGLRDQVKTVICRRNSRCSRPD